MYVFPDQDNPRVKINMDDLSLPAVEYVPFWQGRAKKWKDLFEVSCFVYQERSPSFKARSEMRIGPPIPVRLSSLSVRRPITFRRFAGAIKWNYLRRRKLRHLAGLTESGRYERYRARFLSSLGPHPEMDSLVRRHRPDFIILPSRILDIMADDVLQIAAHHRIPTFLLVGGWDHLSSKGILHTQPSLIGVWGQQTQRHAVEIQGASPENVVCIGAPHYEAFRASPSGDRDAFRQSIGLPLDKKTILFGGSFRQFDETALLKHIDAAIEEGRIGPLHILYRPHPWRLSRDNEDPFFDHSWKHVSIDPAIAPTYEQSKAGKSVSHNDFQYSMSYLNDLLRAVDGVVSPMSTLILEAMMLGTPVLAVAFNDGKHLWSADKTAQMTHFEGLRDVPGLDFCDRSEDFIPLLRQLVTRSEDSALGESLRESTKLFVTQDDSTSYGERLSRLVNERLKATVG